MTDTRRTVRLRIAEGWGPNQKMLLDTTNALQVGTDTGVELFLHGYPTLVAYLSVYPDAPAVEDVEEMDVVSAYPASLIPRITVRDHDDMHMLLALLRDGVDRLSALPEEDRQPAREDALDPLVQAQTMLQNLEELHAQHFQDQFEKPIQEMVDFFNGLGVSVVVIDL